MQFPKNKFFSVLIIIVLVFVALLAWFFFRPSLVVESAYPPNALFYARLTHAQDHWQKFSSSEFFKGIAAIDSVKVMERNGFRKPQIQEFQKNQKNINDLINNPLLQKIWGKEIAVGIYSPKGGVVGYDFLIAARVNKTIQAAELMGGLFRQLNEDVSIHFEMYKGVRISHVEWKKHNLKVSYLRFRDVIFAAGDKSTLLKEAIDIYRKQKPALKSDEKFVAMQKSFYSSSEGIAYMDMDGFLKLFKDQLVLWLSKDPRSNISQDKTRIEESFNQAGAFPSYGFSFQSSNVNRFKFITSVLPEKMTPELRRIFSCKGGVNQSTRLVPSNVIAYNWGTCYDFGEYWSGLKEQMQISPELASEGRKIARGVQNRLKVNIERDVVPLLGNEVGGYLTDIDTTGLVPFPRMLAFIKIKDQKGMQAILDKITANPISKLQSEEYEGVKIQYISLPFGANLDPGYTFIDDYLLLSTSRQLLKKSAEVVKNSARSLEADKDYQSFDLKTKVTSITFLKTGEVAKRFIDLSGWISKYLSSQVGMASVYKEEAQQKRKELTAEIKEKAEELKLAQKKLGELKSQPMEESPEALTTYEEKVGHLQREADQLSHEIQVSKIQLNDLQRLAATYDVQANSFKLMVFNIEQVVVPVLKAFSSIEAQSVKIKVEDRIVETELVLKDNIPVKEEF